ncbi:hypothetical protein C0J52_17632 [Blattella germanica]|nr:hypothetical protein C0J52_17632 [Blattella germanica]
MEKARCIRLTKEWPRFKDELDTMKFICTDFWSSINKKQIDNLRTNHQGVYVLQDNAFRFLTKLSSGRQYLEMAPKHGCPNCGFSHCNKCLKYNAVVPKLGEKEVKVCGPCYNFYIRKGNEKSTKDEYSPPESFMSSENSSSSSLLPSVPSDINYSSSSTGIDSESSAREMLDQPIVRRLESLENPARPPITLYRQDSRLQKLKAGLNETDREIAERLEKLKEERKKQPPPKNELASQLPDSADEIAERLAKLRATGTPSSSANFGLPSVIPSNVDDEFSLSTMQEAFEAVALEQKLEEEELEDSDDKKKVQSKNIEGVVKEKERDGRDTFIDKFVKYNTLKKEFPWCIICNDNAAIRCIDCDDDLYCKQCFKQGHDEWDLKDHKFVPFKKSD